MPDFTFRPKDVPGHLMYWKVWGSHSHGTAKPDSDVDYSGVYVLPTEALLGIYRPVDTVVGEKPDFQLHEVGKFCELLLKGNPGIVEMLFTEELHEYTSAWMELKKESHRFLSKRTVTNYLGYAEGQLKKIAKGTSVHTKGGQPSEKWAYHLVRLLWDAQRINSGGFPKVMKDGEELETLMKIRRGETRPEEVVESAASLIQTLRNTESSLPENGDQEFLENWLQGIRRTFYGFELETIGKPILRR